mgnify:CR=1 FL=1
MLRVDTKPLRGCLSLLGRDFMQNGWNRCFVVGKMYSSATNSTFKRSRSLLASKQKKKPKKATPTIEELIASGVITKASQIKPKEETKAKSRAKKTKTSPKSSSAAVQKKKKNSNDPIVTNEVRMIGKCIKYTQPGATYNKWVNNNLSTLRSFDLIPKAQLRRFVSQTAKELFGIEQLRPLQKDAILDFLRPARIPNHVIVLAGTGAGKSLIYWLCSVLQQISEDSKRKLTVIVSPLISLLNDQFLQLADIGIPTAVYYGKVSANARKELFESK